SFVNGIIIAGGDFAKQRVITCITIGPALDRNGFAMRPFGLDRCNGKEEWTRKVPDGADGRFRDGFLCGEGSELFSKARRCERFDGYKVDGAGNRRAQARG